METAWRPAKLFSTAGLKANSEREGRATSTLLAVMQGVPELTYALLRRFGVPKGRVQTFTEVRLQDAEDLLSIPDGAILVDRGKTRWAALVEVKTGRDRLDADKLEFYLDHARELGMGGVLTITNDITADPTCSPVSIGARKRKGLELWHHSWWSILTEARLLHDSGQISDPLARWLVGELIAYLCEPASGIESFRGVGGSSWVAARDGIRHQTLRAGNKEAAEVAAGWLRFNDYLALEFTQDVGQRVTVVRPRNTDQECLLKEGRAELADAGTMTSRLSVPGAVSDLDVKADLRAQQVAISATIDAPREGRPLPRINWLLRQLKDAPAQLRVDVAFNNTRETSSALLNDAAENPSVLLSSTDAKREPKRFTLTLLFPMGTKRGRGPGAFVDETHGAAIAFYRDVLQRLRAWQAKAPKLSEEAPVDEQILTDTELADETPAASGDAQRDHNGAEPALDSALADAAFSEPEPIPALPRGFKIAAGVKVNPDGSIDL
jgi:hypothetical protein